jgi:phage/conjugal plasmid C-4 type zinc finger TraR family protein
MNERFLEQSERAEARAAAGTVARSTREIEKTGADFCTDCGVEISPARRQAAPFADTCLACQNARERKARRYGW